MVGGLNARSFKGISDGNGAFCLGLMGDGAAVVVATVSCVFVCAAVRVSLDSFTGMPCDSIVVSV